MINIYIVINKKLSYVYMPAFCVFFRNIEEILAAHGEHVQKVTDRDGAMEILGTLDSQNKNTSSS